MRIVEFSNNEGVHDVSFELDREKFSIKWKWPKDVSLVYILKTIALEDFNLDNISDRNVKLYTREEYKEFNGYRETIKELNQYKYWIFPAVEMDGDLLLLKQEDGKNEIIVSTGKPEVLYEIKEKRSLASFFSKDKALEISIYSEMHLPKDALCYVKKHGSYPVSKDDGICFDFINNIQAGENIMPPIVVDKNEYVKVFIKDVEKYGNVYDLKQV